MASPFRATTPVPALHQVIQIQIVRGLFELDALIVLIEKEKSAECNFDPIPRRDISKDVDYAGTHAIPRSHPMQMFFKVAFEAHEATCSKQQAWRQTERLTSRKQARKSPTLQAHCAFFL